MTVRAAAASLSSKAKCLKCSFDINSVAVILAAQPRYVAISLLRVTQTLSPLLLFEIFGKATPQFTPLFWGEGNRAELMDDAAAAQICEENAFTFTSVRQATGQRQVELLLLLLFG